LKLPTASFHFGKIFG